MSIISNTTVLSNFAAIDALDKLRELYEEVYLSTEVYKEIERGYSDFVMNDLSGKPVVGVCHARAGNAYLPPQWLVYFVVADLDASLAKVVERGGKQIGEIRKMGPQDRYCAIQDPAGAFCVLYQAGA